MTRKKLIENIYREFELEKGPLSKKTRKAIDKFTDTFGPGTDFGENDFFHTLWGMIDAIEVDLFRLGFDTAMKLKGMDITDKQEKSDFICGKKTNPGELTNELYDYYAQTHGTEFPSEYDTIQALIDKYGLEAEDLGGSIAAAYEKTGFTMGFHAAMDLRNELKLRKRDCMKLDTLTGYIIKKVSSIINDNDKKQIKDRLKEIEEKHYLNGIRITAYENMLKKADAIDYAYEQKERALLRLWAEQKALAIERCNLKEALLK